MVSDKVYARRRAIAHGIVLVTQQSAVRIAGLSVLQRTVFALERAGVRSITLVTRSAADRSIAAPSTRFPETHVRWSAPEECPRAADGAVLLLLRPVVVNSEAIDALVELCGAANPVVALDAAGRSGRSVATGAYLVAAEAAAEIPRRVAEAISGSDSTAGGVDARARLPAGVCYPLGSAGDAAEIRAAEKMLLGSLRKKTDGFFAYWFDRRISTAISRHLARTGVTPNQISLFTLVLALASAVVIAAPSTLISGLGAILFLISTILDGCDGEVARLKYLESAKGARLDLLCDNAGLVALFLGIIVHVYSEDPGSGLLYAGVAIIGGMVAAMVTEYLLITGPRIRRGEGNGPSTPDEAKRRELYERLASRDFAYLLPVLAFTKTLSWFVWATAVGVNLFWIALVIIVVKKPATTSVLGVTSKLP